MTGWTPLTEAEVLNQFNDSETAAYDTAKGDDKGVALADIIQKVADQIWQAYDQGGRVVDTQGAGTIPTGEKNRAIALVRWNYLNALPSGKSLAENRQPEAKAATDYFLMVAKRELKSPGGVAIARPGRNVRTRGFDGLSTT
jgi:hypothetical protein